MKNEIDNYQTKKGYSSRSALFRQAFRILTLVSPIKQGTEGATISLEDRLKNIENRLEDIFIETQIIEKTEKELKEIKRKLGLDPNYEKSQKFEKEIRDIFTEDCNTVELSGAITVLELNDDLEKDYIEKRINKLILKGILSQTNGKITLL